jgi:hypothetical protein
MASAPGSLERLVVPRRHCAADCDYDAKPSKWMMPQWDFPQRATLAESVLRRRNSRMLYCDISRWRCAGDVVAAPCVDRVLMTRMSPWPSKAHLETDMGLRRFVLSADML